MARTVSFEIYSFKGGNWMLDSVHDDKNMAIHQGRMLISSPHHMAIRVIQETYDEATDNTTSKIIYKEQKGGDEEKPKKTTSKKKGPSTKVKRKKRKKGNTSKSLLVLVLSMGGIGLGLLALLGLLIAKFG
ncbi:MAG: hypothetical protein H8E36_00370 [Rhodospirillaceae bacterium]|nr:hypothetical protein [Rhodospirillaceae bacterium]MBL6941233.1 hypothetical protein [Rhodospirillales bacterium]